MPEYLVTFIGPRGGKGNTVKIFAPRACDALEEARVKIPGMNGRPVDVCRTWTEGIDEEKGIQGMPGFYLIQ